MHTWQLERRKRTRHLIELGGLVVKARIVDLTGDDRATVFGALLWMADKLQSDQGESARALWAAKGKQAFDADPATRKGTDLTAPMHDLNLPRVRPRSRAIEAVTARGEQRIRTFGQNG